jgi:hypothetical protein
MTVSAPTATLAPPALEHLQPIQADYYNIINEEGWPVGALVVLVDSVRDPVRAELHLYGELSDEMRHWAFRRGRSVLETHYYSAEPVPLKIFESYQGRETVHIQANGARRQTVADERWLQGWQVAAGVGVVVLLVAVIWALATFLRSPLGDSATTEPPITQDEAATGDETTNTGAEQPGGATAPGGALPVSQHADPTLGMDVRVRVRPGLRLSLVVEPGPNNMVVGYMQDQQEATIIGGPAYTQGTSDTIVWWRVRLDDGIEAWAPANTSEGPVLERAG